MELSLFGHSFAYLPGICASLAILRRIVRSDTVSPLYFFATLNKERNPPYLQLRKRLNGKMLIFGFVYPKGASIVLQKVRKNTTYQTIAFFAKYLPTHVP